MHCLHAAYGCPVPDKRQTSKQRRAARNRAYREAMMARRENARVEREQARQARASRATGSTGRAGATAAATATTGRPQSPIARAAYGRPAGPGDTAVLVALVAAVFFTCVALYVAFTSKSVPVDHAGDPIASFPAVTREAYAIANNTEPVTEEVTLVDAYGALIPIFAVLPSLVAAGAFVSHRRAPRSRPLTIGLVALALVSVFNLFAMYFLPALIALAIAGFQVRKTELPARMAAGGRTGRDEDEDDDDVIDVDEVEPEDEDVEDYDDEDLEDEDLEDEELEDEDLEPVGEDEEAEDEDEEDADVLAELEAEIEDEPDDEAEPEAEPETGRGGRRRGAGGRSSRR
jgi:hypothetical protein